MTLFGRVRAGRGAEVTAALDRVPAAQRIITRTVIIPGRNHQL